MNTSPSSSATLEDVLRQAALLNTRGVYGLVTKERKNRIPKAVRSFKAALEMMQQAQKMAADRGPQPSSRHCYLEAYSSSPVAPKHQEVQDDSFYVYNRAIFFKPLSDTTPFGITYYTAALHYNMALAYHCEATTTTKTTEAPALSRARRCYKQALKVLKQVGVDSSSAGRPPHPGNGELMIYLRLTSLNNLAHIHRLARDYPQMEVTLRRTFQYTVAHRETFFAEDARQEDNNDSSNKDDHDGHSHSGPRNSVSSITSNPSMSVNEVLLNVMVATGPTAGASAA